MTHRQLQEYCKNGPIVVEASDCTEWVYYLSSDGHLSWFRLKEFDARTYFPDKKIETNDELDSETAWKLIDYFTEFSMLNQNSDCECETCKRLK